MFDENKCGCSWPNARPPCSYCENSIEDESEVVITKHKDGYYEQYKRYNDLDYPYSKEWTKKEYSLDDNEYAPPQLSEADIWRDKYNKLVKELQEYKDSKLDEIRASIYEETLEEMEAYARSEVYAMLSSEMYDDVRHKEMPNIKKQLLAEARDEIYAQARVDILRSMKEASERI